MLPGSAISGIARARQQRDVEHLLDEVVEAQEALDLAACGGRPSRRRTGAPRSRCVERQVAERRGLADLREADERECLREREPASEARQLDDRSPCARAGSTDAQLPRPDSSTHSRPSCQRGECGIDRPAATISDAGTSISTPPRRLVRAPAARLVGPPSAVTYARGRRRPPGRSGGSGPPGRVAVTNGGPSAARSCGGRRASRGRRTRSRRATARRLREAELVHRYVAGHVAVARQVAGVVGALRLDLRGHLGHVAEIPHLGSRARGETSGRHREPIGLS